MIKKNYLLALIITFVFLRPAFAKDDRMQIQGVWQLASYIIEVKETGETISPMGQHPTGYTIFTPEGRTWFMLTGNGRIAANTAEEKAQLLDSMVAYAGEYRIEGDKWITSVQVAWNPTWVGTEQARQFKIEGDRLQVLTPWRIMPNWADKGQTRSIITFVRLKD
ncbi:lipocalin-like domain-containing protein [Orbus sturtevantii]|uniref:lipocalin-like domain-containing protein n=1 Tax=Orbus sturtevantii TaxID=3074109 RepID=UPI00370D2120